MNFAFIYTAFHICLDVCLLKMVRCVIDNLQLFFLSFWCFSSFVSSFHQLSLTVSPCHHLSASFSFSSCPFSALSVAFCHDLHHTPSLHFLCHVFLYCIFELFLGFCLSSCSLITPLFLTLQWMITVISVESFDDQRVCDE